MQLVKGVLEQLGLASELKQGIQFRAGSMLKQPLDPAATAYTYLLDGPSGAPRSGADVAEMTASLWQELQFISAEDVFCEQDYNSYQLLNKVQRPHHNAPFHLLTPIDRCAFPLAAPCG